MGQSSLHVGLSSHLVFMISCFEISASKWDDLHCAPRYRIRKTITKDFEFPPICTAIALAATMDRPSDETGVLERKIKKTSWSCSPGDNARKNTVPKNDEKRRKQLLEDASKLEAELKQKSKEEQKKRKETLPEQNKEYPE